MTPSSLYEFLVASIIPGVIYADLPRVVRVGDRLVGAVSDDRPRQVLYFDARGGQA